LKYNSSETQTQFVQAQDSEVSDIQDNINSYLSNHEDDLIKAAKIGLFVIVEQNKTSRAVPRVGPIINFDECKFEYDCSGSAQSCYSSYGGQCLPTCCENSIFGLIFNLVGIGLFLE